MALSGSRSQFFILTLSLGLSGEVSHREVKSKGKRTDITFTFAICKYPSCRTTRLVLGSGVSFGVVIKESYGQTIQKLASVWIGLVPSGDVGNWSKLQI